MRLFAAASMLAILAACGQQSEPGGPPSEGAASTLADWGAQYAGKAVTEAFPGENSNCRGDANAIQVEDGGARVVGWSWDLSAGHAYDRLISVGPDGVINGTGTTTTDRPDVVANTNGMVTYPRVGFEVTSTATSGVLRVGALDPFTNSVCWVDQVDIGSN